MAAISKGSFRFINLSPIWSAIELIGGMREEQKRDFRSSNLWRGSKSTHIISVAGEMIAAFMLKMQMDASLRIDGDVGYDLPDGTDVKTASYWPPILKHPVNSKKWPKYFALVYFDEKTKRGCLIGKVTKESLRNGKKRKFRDDGPMNYTMEMDDIIRDGINGGEKRNT